MTKKIEQDSAFIEYIEFHKKVNPTNFKDIDIKVFSEPLFTAKTVNSEKQKITFVLAHL